MDATDLTRVKAWMKETYQGTELDAQLNQLIPAISRAIEGPSLLNRKIEAAARTEVRRLTALRTRSLLLREGPVASSPALAVKVDSLQDWTNAAALTAGQDYTLDLAAAVVHFGSPVFGPTWAQVVYTAGFAASLAALETSYPDIVQAANMWVAEAFRMRDSLTARTVSTAGGSVTTEKLVHPPEAVKGLLLKYRWRTPSG